MDDLDRLPGEEDDGLDDLLDDNDDILDDVDDDAYDGDEVNIMDDMLKYDDVKEVAKILRSERMHSHLSEIEKAGERAAAPAISTDDPEYALILDSNKIVGDIDRDIVKVYNFIKDHYALRFPELAQVIYDSVTYAKVVQCIGNAMDITTVTDRLSELVAPHTIMVIQTTGTTTKGRKLTEEELERVNEACEEIFGLEEAKQLILEYVQSRMNLLAPNLSAIVGTQIAAQIIGAAGGLADLAKRPANVIRTLGKRREALGGFSAKTQLFHTGFLLHCDIVKSQPEDQRRKVANLVAAKVTLAVRVDASRSTPDGSYGSYLREEVLKKIAKWREPAPAKQRKALPIPAEPKRQQRAGRKVQRMKAKWKQTEVSKHMNRMNFGQIEADDFIDPARSYGNLKREVGKIQLKAETKVKAKRPRVEQKRLQQLQRSKEGFQSGIMSSLVFTPVQGMELAPAVAEPKTDEERGVSKYFNPTRGFKMGASGNASFLGSTAAGSSVVGSSVVGSSVVGSSVVGSSVVGGGAPDAQT
eukprot:TRINITY_DN70155_c0_g1_i1.p1 TRINITY_DN70155_c0_g1~~TRINITY_DN70155_c0_g1_i1.p1  ORF type:complete len:528 (+),score=196.61 TRINITY_DN70155_c0_g1_i1:89-1672(+)